MAASERLPHFLVRDRAENRDFRRTGGGDPKIRDVEHRAQGLARKRDLDRAFEEVDEKRAETTLEELQALGVVIVLEGAEAAFPLKLDSLEQLSSHRTVPKRPKWLLLSVRAATEGSVEQATVWVSDQYRAAFLQLFEGYLTKTTEAGNPRNRELVANIGRIRGAVLEDLWRSKGSPPDGRRWWEVWLRPDDDAVEVLRAYATQRELRVAPNVLGLIDRTVAWVEGSWSDLEHLPFSAVPVAEIREPEFVDTVEDLSPNDQDELTQDLADRVEPADSAAAPRVCHLDSGVRASHVLLSHSLDPADVHTLFPPSGFDAQNHGTLMAGLALYGPLDDLLLGSGRVRLRHRLESVKILPDSGPGTDPLAYGVATAHAVSLPESRAPRQRVFCMPVTADPDLPGEPSLWSAAVDALAVGADVGQSDDGITVLGGPDPDSARLFVISAGNVDPDDYQTDYRSACDASPVEDPAHAWNALTVGAHTELITVPSDPDFNGWSAVSVEGDISPHSRTSLLFARQWPIKPDICMEGGNVLTDGASDFSNDHPLLSLRTTDARDDTAIGSANATSAATAQAARLAAMAQTAYPSYWPETVKGLLVHAAEWTPVMRAEIDAVPGKRDRLNLLCRYGWGVPTDETVLASSRQAVTLVAQDDFVPFDGPDFAARRFRLHRLPWPTEQLQEIGAADVTLRVTLSYFVEPTASRRGWRRRYSYASHGLRFELKGPTESLQEFLMRVNREAQSEEAGGVPASSRADRWLVGPNQRNFGALHQDIWEGPGAELAEMGTLAVHPVGGWWKNRKVSDRVDRPVRYALIVSLKTAEQGIDLYAPIAVQLELPIEATVPGS